MKVHVRYNRKCTHINDQCTVVSVARVDITSFIKLIPTHLMKSAADLMQMTFVVTWSSNELHWQGWERTRMLISTMAIRWYVPIFK